MPPTQPSFLSSFFILHSSRFAHDRSHQPGIEEEEEEEEEEETLCNAYQCLTCSCHPLLHRPYSLVLNSSMPHV